MIHDQPCLLREVAVKTQSQTVLPSQEGIKKVASVASLPRAQTLARSAETAYVFSPTNTLSCMNLIYFKSPTLILFAFARCCQSANSAFSIASV